MVSQSTLKRIDRFKRSLEKLKRISKIPLKDYISNTDLQDIAERNLQVATEAIVDLGQKIISAKGWRVPSIYREIIDILEENRVIKRNLSSEIKDFVSLRNIIVHMQI